MTNKTQLQANNTALSTALDTLHGLPQADDVKHGGEAWIKYDYSPATILKNLQMTITQSYSDIAITPANFTLPTEKEFFDGFKYSGDKPRFYMKGGALTFVTRSGSETSVSSYDPLTGKITLSSNGATSDNGTYELVCAEKTTKKDVKTFNSYVVSNAPNKYPDDGARDGFYYKKIYAENATEYGIFYLGCDDEGYPTDLKIVQSDTPKTYLRHFQPTDATFTMLTRVKRIEIITKKIGEDAFKNFFYLLDGTKMKIKCNSIGTCAFGGIGARSENAPTSVWIDDSCMSIPADVNTSSPFYQTRDTTKIYCKAATKPASWGAYWNISTYATLTTTWGVTESQFDDK